MERHASAVKAARQALKRRAHNQAIQSSVKTMIRKVREATKKKGDKADLTKLLNTAQKVLMKAGSKGIIKPETASRYISRLSRDVHAAQK